MAISSTWKEEDKQEMNKNNARNNKRQRLDDDDEEKADAPSGIDVRLNEELRGLLGGRKYVKAKDLTRAGDLVGICQKTRCRD
jgi:hypothetical protein